MKNQELDKSEADVREVNQNFADKKPTGQAVTVNKTQSGTRFTAETIEHNKVIQGLTLSDKVIHQDSEGRYCLNDLHKLAGSYDKHKPANFLRLDTTEALITELSFSDLRSLNNSHFSDLRSAIKITIGGKSPSTYAIKELVYAYAMWISPKFHRHVIQAYDDMVTKPKTSAHIYRTIANEIKQTFPDMRITDQLVLLNNNKGRNNMSGETREQCQYYRQMDKYALPGIIAIENKPYKVLFDWLEQYQHPPEVITAVYQALNDRCGAFRSYLPKRKPFQDHANTEEVHGLKTASEAIAMAADMAKIVADLLAVQPKVYLAIQSN